MIDVLEIPRNETFLTIDVEGDGYHDQRPVEISICEFKKGVFSKEHYFLLNPGRGISPFATRVNRITNQMVKGRPTFGAVEQQIRNLVKDSFLIGHAVTNDLAMLSRAMPEFRLLPKLIFDTQRIGRHLSRTRATRLPEGLGKLALTLGIDKTTAPKGLGREGLHSASLDAWITGQVFSQMLPLLPDDIEARRHYLRLFSLQIAPRKQAYSAATLQTTSPSRQR
jgi:DNA polymerase III epsilon subunit-like protein